MGNLDYNSNAEPLHNSLLKALKTNFRKRIRLDMTDLPESNGESRGYGFVTLSWADIMGRSCQCEPIRHLQGIFWDDRCKLTIYMSSGAAQRKPPDWVSGPEGIGVNRKDVNYNMSTRLPIPEGCLTATCDLFGNGKYGGQTDTYQSWEHEARPT